MPCLVLSLIDTRSIRAFFVSEQLRSIAPTLPLVAFVIVQPDIEASAKSAMTTTVSNNFLASYALATIGPGMINMAVGCGFATLAVVAVAFYLGWSMLPGKGSTSRGRPEFLGYAQRPKRS
jgi:hypothetical protein